jgi:hypothetical protein
MVNRLLMYAVMLDSPIVVYKQFMTVLIELQKVLSQELSVCVARLSQPNWNKLYQKPCMCISYIFTALEINTYITQKCIYTVYTVHVHSAGAYVHQWYSHTLYRMFSIL